MQNIIIKEIPHTERPREKALQYGIESLSNGELLALILENGSKGINVLTLSQLLLQKFSNFRHISNCSLGELTKIKGIGKAKAIKIKACFEIARRFQEVNIQPGIILQGSKQVFYHYHEKLRDQKREKFFSILLDSKHRVIKEELISIGSLNLSIVHPREVFSLAIKEAAESILFVHNHPSGQVIPSKEDIYVTKRLVEAGKIIGIEVLDHIIIGNGVYISFLEEKLF